MRLRISDNKVYSVSMETTFSGVVALLPVFATYASGIPGFSVADILLAFFMVMVFLTRRFNYLKNDFVADPLIMVIALFLIILFGMISFMLQTEPDYVNVAIRLIRYYFYLAVIVVCCRSILDLDVAKRALKAVAVAGTIFLMIQAVFYNFFEVIINGFLPFLRLYTEQYALTDYAEFYAQNMFRPTSFFLEPAHFARYSVIAIIIFLFNSEKISGKELVGAIFVSVGVLMSTSAQGYALMAVVWMIWFVKRVKDIKSYRLRMLGYFTIVLIPFIVTFLFSLPQVQRTVLRAVSGNIFDANSAAGARLSYMSYYFDLDPIFKVIGMGFGSVPDGAWFASAIYWLYGAGIIVFTLFIIYAVICFFKLRGTGRYILLVFMMLFLTDDSFYSYMCVIFISLSLIEPKNKYIMENQV